MNNDTVVSLAAPARVSDPLTELLRTGARRLIEAAVSAEFEEYLSGFVQEQLPDGRQRVVRNGHLPERKILTGVGEVDVRVPMVAHRRAFAGGFRVTHPRPQGSGLPFGYTFPAPKPPPKNRHHGADRNQFHSPFPECSWSLAQALPATR